MLRAPPVTRDEPAILFGPVCNDRWQFSQGDLVRLAGRPGGHMRLAPAPVTRERRVHPGRVSVYDDGHRTILPYSAENTSPGRLPAHSASAAARAAMPFSSIS